MVLNFIRLIVFSWVPSRFWIKKTAPLFLIASRMIITRNTGESRSRKNRAKIQPVTGLIKFTYIMQPKAVNCFLIPALPAGDRQVFSWLFSNEEDGGYDA